MSQFNAGSIVSRGADAIQEVLGKATLLEMKRKRTFQDLILSNVTPQTDSLGRNMTVTRTFYVGGASGTVQGYNHSNHVGTEGESFTGVGSANRLQRYGSAGTGANTGVALPFQTFPNAAHGVQTVPFDLGIRLYGYMFNTLVTHGEAQLSSLQANTVPYLANKISGLSKLISQTLELAFMGNRAQQFRIASFSTVAAEITVGDDTTRTITFRPVEEVFNKFVVGMPVDIYTASSATAFLRINQSFSGNVRVMCFVTAKDEALGTVTITADQADVAGTARAFTAWGTAAALAGGGSFRSFVTLGGTAVDNASGVGNFQGMSGWRDWLKWSTADPLLLGGATNGLGATNKEIDVTVHPELRSMAFTNVGTLTRLKLAEYISTFNDKFDQYGYSMDALYASRGVLLNMIAQFENRSSFNEGPGLQPLGLRRPGYQEQGAGIEVDGNFYPIVTLPLLERGTVVGMKLKDNWTFITPKPPAETNGMLPGAGEAGLSSKIPIQFIAPFLTGTSSTRLPYLNATTNAITTAYQMPCMVTGQFAPKENGQIPGLILEGAAVNRVYGNAS